MSNLVTSKAALIGFYEGSLKSNLELIEMIQANLDDKDFIRLAMNHLEQEVRNSISNGDRYWKEIQG